MPPNPHIDPPISISILHPHLQLHRHFSHSLSRGLSHPLQPAAAIVFIPTLAAAKKSGPQISCSPAQLLRSLRPHRCRLAYATATALYEFFGPSPCSSFSFFFLFLFFLVTTSEEAASFNAHSELIGIAPFATLRKERRRKDIKLKPRPAELAKSQNIALVPQKACDLRRHLSLFSSELAPCLPLPLLRWSVIVRSIPCCSCISLTYINPLARHSNRAAHLFFFPRDLADDTNTEIRHRLLSNLSRPNHIRGIKPPRRRNRAQCPTFALPLTPLCRHCRFRCHR